MLQKWQCEELCEFPVFDGERETYGRMSQETALRIITYWNGDSGGGAAQSTGFDLLHYILLCCREIKLMMANDTSTQKVTGAVISQHFNVVCIIYFSYFNAIG